MSKQGWLIVVVVVLLIGGIGAAIGWYCKPSTVQVQDRFVEVPQIKEVVKIKTVKVPGPKEIHTIEKQTIINTLPLPQAVKDDPNQQVTATGTIEPDRNRGDVEAVATINTATGQGAVFMRQKDRAFLGLPNEKEIGIGYGIDSKGKPGATVYGRWDVLRVGSVVIHAYGEINQTPDARVQLRAGYRF